MTRIIAAIFTLCVIALVVYLLFTAPWVIGVIIIGGGFAIIAWIVIMAIYAGTLTVLTDVERKIRHRKIRRQSEDKS